MKAVAKVPAEHPEARYLVFQSVLRGQEAYRDPIVWQTFEARLRQHALALRADWDIWRKYVGESAALEGLTRLVTEALGQDDAAPIPVKDKK